MAPWVEAQTRRFPRNSHSRDLPDSYRYQIEFSCDNHWLFFSMVATTNHTPFRVAARDRPSKSDGHCASPLTGSSMPTSIITNSTGSSPTPTPTPTPTKKSTPPKTQDLFSLIALLHFLYSFVQPILPTTPVTISTSPLIKSLAPQLHASTFSIPSPLRYSLLFTRDNGTIDRFLVTSRCDFNNLRPACASLLHSPSVCRGDNSRSNNLAHHGSLTVLPAPSSPPLPPSSPQIFIAATVVRLPLVDGSRSPAAAYPSPLLFLHAFEDRQQHSDVFARTFQPFAFSAKSRHLRIREQYTSQLHPESSSASFADAQS
jgi:hypothetical protein